jgi:acyl dehydratase
MPGKHFNDLEEGITIHHSLGRTITETDNVLFNALTMNTQPLHLNEDFSSKTQFVKRGILTLGVVIGIAINELTAGILVANLGYKKVEHPKPVFYGDTIYVETQVLEKKRLSLKT